MERSTTEPVARLLQRTAPPTDGIITAAAMFLMTSGPRAWRSLLRAHVPDDSGHCAGCPSTAAPSPVWPCTLWFVGDAADQFARTRSTPDRGRRER